MALVLRNLWRGLWDNGLGIAIMFSLLFAAIRGIGMLGPTTLRVLIPMGFMIMMILPFVFLTRKGRRQIGFVASQNLNFYGIAIIYGVVAPTVCFIVGVLFFDSSSDNWFITIRNYYYAQVPTTSLPTLQFFIIVTIPAMIFSPIGEEIFFRGFLQEALNTRYSLQRSMILECLLFGLVHLFHHGLVRVNGQVHFYFLSGVLWVMLMFFTAYGFALLRKRSGSIYPAILAHAVFNLVMNGYIFVFLLGGEV